MSLAKTRYRVRGLPEMPVAPPPKDPFVSGNLRDKTDVPWEAVRRAVDRPNLSDYLHDAHTWRFERHWPTSDFLRRSEQCRPIKRLPMALAEYMDGREDDLTAEICQAWEKRTRERTSIELLLKTASEGADFSFGRNDLPAVSSALAALFFRGSRSLKQHRAKVLERILQKPEAAYLALLSGAWPEAGGPLIHSVRTDPNLALDVWRYPELMPLTPLVSPDLIHEMAPHLYSVIQPIHIGLIREECWNRLVSAAETNRMAAAFALALAPFHTDAAGWYAAVKQDAEAMYWSVRVGSQRVEPSSLPYWSYFQLLVRCDPRWGYHWVRDFEPGTPYAFISDHWPNLWALELAVDLRLSHSALVSEYERTKESDAMKNPIGTVVTLWLADQAIKVDEEDS
jgi:hypothetical protein